MYYVVQVYGRKDDETIEYIKKIVPSDIATEIFSPSRIIRKKYKNTWKDVKERCFPGYIFIDTPDPEKLFAELKKVPMFTKLLGRSKDGDIYITLTKKECRLIDTIAGRNTNRIMGISDVLIEPGNKIKIIAGPFVGNEGLLVKYDLHKRIAYVDVDFLSRKIQMKVGINLIVEANKNEHS